MIRRFILYVIIEVLICKFNAHWPWHDNVVVSVGEQAGGCIAFEHLNHVAVAAGYKHEFAVWCDVEVARMRLRVAVAHFLQRAVA